MSTQQIQEMQERSEIELWRKIHEREAQKNLDAIIRKNKSRVIPKTWD